MKSGLLSNSTHMKLALEKCGTNKRRMIGKVVTLLNSGNEEDLNRPFKCIDKVYCNFLLEQFLVTSSWRRWNGETIIMGDFNEVRSSDERRGSCFNPYTARHFDRFISNSGLVDVTLEGFMPRSSLIGPSSNSASGSSVGFWTNSISILSLLNIIRSWVKAKRLEVSCSKNEMISELGEIDKVMDRGEFDDATVFRRFELKHKLLNVTEMEAKDRF
ncbi:RNA-directed DNA polymerase, eukaryota [Tanacetum coccineum]